MESTDFLTFSTVTSVQDREAFEKFMHFANNDIERAIELYFSMSKSINQETTKNLKRTNPWVDPSPNDLHLGDLISEAVALKFLPAISELQTWYYKTSQPQKLKKGQRLDTSIRLSQEHNGFSVAKLNSSLCDILHPLISGDLISLSIKNLYKLNLNVLDSFQVMISINLKSSVFSKPSMKINEEAAAQKIPIDTYVSQRDSLQSLISLLNIKKTQSALVTKSSDQVTIAPEEPTDLSESDKTQCLQYFEQLSLKLSKPSHTFKSLLFPYQAQALTWMLDREKSYKPTEDLELHHLWEEYTLSSNQKIFINSCTGQISIEFPQACELCKGGVLADEMGLGKTVMMIALIHSNVRTEERIVGKRIKKANLGGTLIVVPLSLISQWKNEIEYHGEGKNVLEFYSERSKNLNEVKAADIVITTYGVLVTEATNKGVLMQVEWFRVILDEAHTIRNKNTSTAMAVFKLQAEHKWALTGTPIQNTIDDLYSLVRFLELEPWNDYTWWNRIITQRFLKKNLDCFKILQRLLKPIMLRRTKSSRLENGESIITLPPLIISNVEISLSPKEMENYNRLFSASKAKYQCLLSEGKIKTHVACIFELLLRLRQFCDHPYLILSRGDVKSPDSIGSFLSKYSTESNSNYIETLCTNFKSGQDLDCPVCLDICDDPVITKCAHVLCRTCALLQVEKNRNCPLCKTSLMRSDLTTLPRDSKFCINVNEDFKLSAKMHELMKIINTTTEATVVFTQWASMLDLLEIVMKNHSVSYCRLDGSLTKAQRDESISQFKAGKRVLLISLKAGGVGLNLTCASQVVLLDPWWNPAAERQAIERVHRIGQLREVKAYKFVCTGTVEEKIIEMQQRKEKIVEGAFTDEVCSLNLETLKLIFQAI